MDIYLAGKYPPPAADTVVNSCFSIYSVYTKRTIPICAIISQCFTKTVVNNYSPKWRWLTVDIYLAGKYPPPAANTVVNSCSSIYSVYTKTTIPICAILSHCFTKTVR